ncbi:MAG: S8 family serine peptidase, partial [Psychrosphaera sp.]|nr:S8 family serine peptidase [Psychrosphaera sp.]
WVSVSELYSRANVTGGGGIYWASESPVANKMSMALDEDQDLFQQAYEDNGVMEVTVQFFGDVPRIRALALLSNSPTVELVRWLADKLAVIKINQTQLKLLASKDIVQWMEPAPAELTTYNQVAAQRIKVDVVRGHAPYHYHLKGKGVTVGVWDEARVYAHKDLKVRVTYGDSSGVSTHGSHVGGTIAGDGKGNDQATGMAPKAEIISYDWNNDTQEMRAAKDKKIVISNHSYGAIAGWYWNGRGWTDSGRQWFGVYSTLTQEWDDIVYDNDLIIFKAAGNDRHDGPGCPSNNGCDGPFNNIATRGVAKNIITIGATTDSDGMTQFSGWGPTNDGRIKPDLTANGFEVLSTIQGDRYASMSGTSMASPSAA